MSLFDLTGRTALVTGANTGIGRAIAVELARAGAAIVAVGRSPMDETGAAVRALEIPFHAIKADLASIQPIDAVVEEARAWRGSLDIVVNNAGIIRRAEAVDFTEADWDAVMDVNLKSVFFMCQAAGRVMLKQARGGRIVNIASLLSFQGGIRVPSYTAAKHGVAGITKLLANEWASKGVNVNAIAPGYVRTNNTKALQEDEERNAAILSRIPAGRWGDPQDIAGAAVFLASDAAAYVHGTVVTVDGGWMAR